MSIRYSQDFKDSIAIWAKQATPIMIKGQSKTLKDVKQLEKRLAILC